MFRVQADTPAAPETVWALIAEPRRWSSWAPHIRGAVGLGSPEVQPGRRGVVIVAFLAPVPVRVTAKDPGRCWEWAAGPVRFRHRVEPHGTGSRISLELEAPQPLETIIAKTYGRLISLVIRRLTTVAAE